MSSRPSPSAATVLWALSYVFMWSQSSRAMFFSSVPAASAELGLASGAAGLITGSAYLGNAIALWSSGFLPWSTRRIVPLGLAVSVLMQWAFAAAGSGNQMMAVTAVGGLAVGLYLPRGAAIIVEQFPSGQRSGALAVHETAATVGLMAGPLFLGAALTYVSWRWAVVAWSLTGVVAAWAALRFMPESRTRGGGMQGRIAPLPLDYRVPALALMGGAMFTLVGGFAAALPQLLVVGWGVTPAAAASFAGYTRLGGIAGIILGGYLAERVGSLRLMAWGHVVGLFSVLAMAGLGYGVAFGVVLVLMTAVVSAGTPAFFSLVATSFRVEERERIFGVISASGGLIGVVSPPVILGFLAGIWPAPAVIAAVAVAPLLGLAATGWYALGARRRP